MATIVVYVEQTRGKPRRASLETLGAAASGGHTVVAVVADEQAQEAAKDLGRYGANKVVCFEGDGGASADGTALDVATVAREHGAKACLAAATSTGKDLLPRVAALLDSTPFADCTAFEMKGERASVVRPLLAGKVLASFESDAPVFCATLRPNVFPLREREAVAEILSAPVRSPRKAVVVEVAAKAGGKLDVQEAPIVVSGGRGMKAPEHFHLIEELAAAFGNAAVGSSRAVVDAGWRPHAEQVGQTGKTVSPQLYIAVGISGAIQHLAGMRTSKVIVAINKDASAPIFKVADYGIVGDVFEVVPALTEAVKAARAQR